MRIVIDVRVVTAAAGIVLACAAIPAAAQSNPNLGPQPANSSPYPTPNDPLAGGGTSAKTGSVGDTMIDAQNRQMDKRFLGQVTQASLLNIALGKLASEKSANGSVKEFGQKMVSDHERGLAIFKKVALRDGIEVDQQLDSKHQGRLDKLTKLNGNEFDRAYIKDQLKAHQRLVSYFQSEADNTTESTATRLAANMLPAVQRHLDAVKELNKNLTTVASAH